jgi:hypothetical protein
MKKILFIVMMMILLPLAGCHASGSIGESSSIAQSLTHIC